MLNKKGLTCLDLPHPRDQNRVLIQDEMIVYSLLFVLLEKPLNKLKEKQLYFCEWDHRLRFIWPKAS